MKTAAKIAARCHDARGNRPAVIVCLGDSVTHGCFELLTGPDGHFVSSYRPYEGYVARLSRQLNLLFPAAAPCVMSAGVGGDSAGGGLNRLERDVLSLKPDLVIVNFGLNDACNKDVEGGLAAYQRNMHSIFEKVLESGAEAMLLTPNRMCSYVSGELTNPETRDIARHAADIQNDGVMTRYVQTAKEVARERGIAVADAYAKWQALDRLGADTTALLSNHINHPLAEMHDLFVNAVLDQLLM